jgi:hypothetical protein
MPGLVVSATDYHTAGEPFRIVLEPDDGFLLR